MNQRPPHAPVAIDEWMDGLELRVGDGGLSNRRECIVVWQKSQRSATWSNRTTFRSIARAIGDCRATRTKVGNPAPGFVGDPLRIWREVTARRGVALYMHYSGVWDSEAILRHPDWGAINADGKTNTNATSFWAHTPSNC